MHGRPGCGAERRAGRRRRLHWTAQRAPLAERYQLVTYDQNGTGENAGPLPAAYGMATMAQELWQALEKAGITRFALVGHALGEADRPAAGARRAWAVKAPGAGPTQLTLLVELFRFSAEVEVISISLYHESIVLLIQLRIN